jgi:hypothetical protein
MLKEQTVTLRIRFDSENYDAPENWNWSGIIDTSSPEEVELLDYSDVTICEDHHA